MSSKFDTALSYAANLHRDQVRKGSNVPYIAHLLSVSARVLSHGGNEDQATAALLHDAAEDQGGRARLDDIRSRFGDGVALIVADCTDTFDDPKAPWKERKMAYLAGLPKKHPSSLLVSLADKVDNAQAILSDYRVVGEQVWLRFTGGREGTLWYYASLRDVFREALPGPLADDLSRAVAEFPLPR